MSEGVDDGETLSQRSISLDSRETATSLYKKITDLIPVQLEEIISQRRYGSEFEGLNCGGVASYWRKRSRFEGRIDWRMAAKDIDALVRALTWPYSGAECLDPRTATTTKIDETEPFAGAVESGVEPGRVLGREGGKLLIACGNRSAIWLIRHGLRGTYEVGESLVTG